MSFHWETEVTGATLAEVKEAVAAEYQQFFGEPLAAVVVHYDIRPGEIVDHSGFGSIGYTIPYYVASVKVDWA